MSLANPSIWHGAQRTRRVRMLGKPCYFRYAGSWWCAAELGGEVYVRRMEHSFPGSRVAQGVL